MTVYMHPSRTLGLNLDFSLFRTELELVAIATPSIRAICPAALHREANDVAIHAGRRWVFCAFPTLKQYNGDPNCCDSLDGSKLRVRDFDLRSNHHSGHGNAFHRG